MVLLLIIFDHEFDESPPPTEMPALTAGGVRRIGFEAFCEELDQEYLVSVLGTDEVFVVMIVVVVFFEEDLGTAELL